MTKTTISPNGEIVIPEALRERLNLKAGTQLSIDVQGEALVMKPLAESYPDWRTMEGMAKGGKSYPDWRTMRGMAKGGVSLTQALMEERAAELAHDEARAKGH